MKFLFLVVLLPLLTHAVPSRLSGIGQRQLDDRALGMYRQVLGPFAENQTLSFPFEHLMEGKYFTALVVSAEPIYVSLLARSTLK